MRKVSFEPAYLHPPSGGGNSPDWLDGSAKGKPVYILGGAGGLLDSPGLQRARGQIVIGTNWTLRALDPSIWLAVDKSVWLSERDELHRSDRRVIPVVRKGIFGGSIYSTKQNQHTRAVGGKPRRLFEIGIATHRTKVVRVGKKTIAGWAPPFQPEGAASPFHPSGNSLCYAIQLAHAMGCAPIYPLGFTLQPGSVYFFGDKNPVTKKPAFYRTERPLHWLGWYQKTFPDKVRLLADWHFGPLKEIFRREEYGSVEENPEGSAAQHSVNDGWLL